MKDARKKLGDQGEKLALAELQRQGYHILDTNWRHSTRGEIDIVAQEGDTLALVEVRTRRGTRFGSPEESITPAKQKKLIELALTCVQEKGWTGYWRIDVVAVAMDAKGRLQRVTLIRNAVTG